MRVIAVFAFIHEPAVRPDLGWSEHLLPGPQDDAHRLVVEDEREACHTWRQSKTLAAAPFVLRAVVPTCYGFDKTLSGQSDTFNAGCAVSS